MKHAKPLLRPLLRPGFCVASLSWAAINATAATENWPGWRGPRGDGSSLDPAVPVHWNPTEDTVWKTPLPGKGHASPIIWKNRVFVVSAMEETQERLLLCLDRETGERLWVRTALKAPLERLHRLNSHASSTPATDGERVYVSFLDRDQMFIAAYRFDGEKLWEARPGVFSSIHGYCSSPALWGDLVIVNGDHDGDAYLVALDRSTGEIAWKTPRPNRTRSYCTPLFRRIDHRDQMILSGSKCVASFDPATGKQHWLVDGPTEQFVASLVYNRDLNLLFMTCGYPTRHMLAIRPDGSGNVTASHVLWHHKRGAAYVPSPAAVGPFFIVVADNGVASCFEAGSGERLWRQRLENAYSASLLTANGLVYFVADNGVTTVVRPGPAFDRVAENKLGQEVRGSPAVHRGHLFLRGDSHLFCLRGGDDGQLNSH